MAKVFISAGHGGSDPGAVGNGFEEADLNLSIALACRDYLEARGVSVLMSRSKDEDDRTNDEVAESNAYNPDLTVSIHNNAGGGDGAEVYYSIVGGLSKTLAEKILAEIVKIGQNSRGIKTKQGSDGRDYYGFIRRTEAPAVIVECAFVDNSKDIKIIDTESERKVMGEAIAKGILATLGVSDTTPETKPENTPVTKPATKTNEEIAKEVMAGHWGNGVDRASALKAAGYDYHAIQKIVNDMIYGIVPSGSSKPATKSVEELAREVIRGEWGNGKQRKERLTAAGYDYSAIQKKVNELL